MLPDGLQPTSQYAMHLYQRLGRRAYQGPALGAAERYRLAANIASLDGLLSDNHRVLTAGRSVAEAYMLMHLPERAALAQLRAMAAHGGRIKGVSDELAALTCRQWVGDGSERDGDIEGRALLCRLRRQSPGNRD